MTAREIVVTLEGIIEAALDDNDFRLAAAERRFRWATCLPVDDATDQALGYLTGALGEAYGQAVTAAFLAGMAYGG